MFSPRGSFSSFSVNDVAQAKAFYGQVLGLAVADGEKISVIKGGGLLA